MTASGRWGFGDERLLNARESLALFRGHETRGADCEEERDVCVCLLHVLQHADCDGDGDVAPRVQVRSWDRAISQFSLPTSLVQSGSVARQTEGALGWAGLLTDCDCPTWQAVLVWPGVAGSRPGRRGVPCRPWPAEAVPGGDIGLDGFRAVPAVQN